jgi:hypothetical protein
LGTSNKPENGGRFLSEKAPQTPLSGGVLRVALPGVQLAAFRVTGLLQFV